MAAVATSRQPVISTSPALGRSMPAAQCSKVDLPEPEGPMTAVIVPAAKSRVTSSSAVTARSPVP